MSCGCFCRRRAASLLPLLLLLAAGGGFAATVTVQTNRLGPTPTLLGYNAGHFFPGSNTRDWWRYSGALGARLFLSPSSIEPSDDLKPVGDGVVDQPSFLSRRTGLRANPLDTNFIHWPYFISHFESTNSELVFSFALRELGRLGVESCAQITVGQSRFPLTGAADWAGKWELWQHFYAQSFHLAREFGVRRFQMFNEPNHPNANGLTLDDFLVRLQLCSDAAQCALADVNRLYGRTLVPVLLAPVTSGSADGSYPGWGAIVVTNRHLNFLGHSDAGFSLIHKYDYHQYNSTPAAFGTDLADLAAKLTSDMAPEPRLPVAISEFNVHTAATFDGLTETLDTPVKYTRFGSIVANLTQNGCDELYAFKFSQTLNEDTVKKNGMHFVDNTNAPYNIGGITQAGEVWRLFNRAAAPGRDRLQATRGSGATGLDLLATRDVAAGRFHLFSVNPGANADLTVDFSAWGIPPGNRVLISEVSEDRHGAGRLWTDLPTDRRLTLFQASNTVLLFSVPVSEQEPVETLLATDDALVKDGSNKNTRYGSNTVLWVKNNSTNANARNAALLKFRVPRLLPDDLEFAVLRLRAASISGAANVQAHVYGLTNHAWFQSNVTWSLAPNLAQGRPPGVAFTNNFVLGAGDSAFMLGQLVAGQEQTECMLDVTDFVRSRTGQEVTFLLAREVRFHGDAQDEDGLAIVSLEGDSAKAPRLDLVRRRDTDGDGASDRMETTQLGTDPDQPDTDGDGVNDGDEVFSGTDPRDPASCLRITPLRNGAGGGFRLEWPSATNRWYRVLRSDAVASGAWQQVHQTNGTGTVLSWLDVAAPGAPRWFYRLAVELIPAP